MSKKYLISAAIVAVIFLGVATYASIVSNDSQLFTSADKNGDGVLDKNEFMNYIKLTQREKQIKSKQNGVRICPRTGEICEENCSGDGCCMEGEAKSGCCKDKQGAAKSGCCKDKQGAAKSGCCKDKQGAAKSGCCKDKQGAAKSGCCKDKQGTAKSGCCKDKQGAAKSGCCKDKQGAAKSGCCKDKQGAAKSGCCKDNKINNNTTKDAANLDKTAPSNEAKSVNEKPAPDKK